MRFFISVQFTHENYSGSYVSSAAGLPRRSSVSPREVINNCHESGNIGDVDAII